MHRESNQGRPRLDAAAERLVVLQVAGVPRGRQRSVIDATLADVGRERVDAAIDSLQRAGVVLVVGRAVRQSAVLERLDRLKLICV